MQKPQEHGESLSTSEQLPSFSPAESQAVESIDRGSQGVFAAFENASIKSQVFAIAISATVLSTLAVLVALQIFAPTASSQWLNLGLAAFVTGITVGGTTWVLGRMMTNQINRSIDNLLAQFQAVVQGDLGVRATVCSPNELGQLARSFNQMTQAIDTRLNEAQHKAEEKEKEKEDLQHKVMQIIHSQEFTSESNSTLQAEVPVSEDNDSTVPPPGTLLDFLDSFHKWSQLPTTPELLIGSSTLEEIQQRKEQLQYRQVWLQAILEETQREIKLLSPITQLTDKNRVRESNED